MRIILLFFVTLAATAQITQTERLKWAAYSSIGPPSLAAGVFTSAYSTARNSPKEYGPHWEGYFKRQGLRVAGSATSNLMEAEIGALWGEDPRYRRSQVAGVKGRVWHAVKTAFIAYDRKGDPMPAYARFVAVPASNVISNAWQPDSQRTVGQTTGRIGLGFLSRMAANGFAEFWPDIKKKISRK